VLPESTEVDGAKPESTCRSPHLARIQAGCSTRPPRTCPGRRLARTFDVDAKSCADCGGRLDVRAVVTDPEVHRRTVDAVPTAARAPPPLLDAAVVSESAFA
jgi:hypothetical protein